MNSQMLATLQIMFRSSLIHGIATTPLRPFNNIEKRQLVNHNLKNVTRYPLLIVIVEIDWLDRSTVIVVSFTTNYVNNYEVKDFCVAQLQDFVQESNRFFTFTISKL